MKHKKQWMVFERYYFSNRNYLIYNIEDLNPQRIDIYHTATVVAGTMAYFVTGLGLGAGFGATSLQTFEAAWKFSYFSFCSAVNVETSTGWNPPLNPPWKPPLNPPLPLCPPFLKPPFSHLFPPFSHATSAAGV